MGNTCIIKCSEASEPRTYKALSIVTYQIKNKSIGNIIWYQDGTGDKFLITKKQHKTYKVRGIYGYVWCNIRCDYYYIYDPFTDKMIYRNRDISFCRERHRGKSLHEYDRNNVIVKISVSKILKYENTQKNLLLIFKLKQYRLFEKNLIDIIKSYNFPKMRYRIISILILGFTVTKLKVNI